MLASAQSRSTGKERDTETGLDYFAARYYGSNTGRWMSPDWADKPTAVPYAMFGDPQTLNLYGYVRNNPLSRFDPDGHDDITYDQHGKEIERKNKHGFWWHLAHNDNYSMQVGTATYKLSEKPENLGQGTYTLIDARTTTTIMGIFLGKNAKGPNDSVPDGDGVRTKSRPGGQWDLKNQVLIPAYGRHALFMLGDTAHPADDVGNITWGYIMSSYGYMPLYAHTGAGLQSWQTYHRLDWCIQSLCDDPKDFKNIELGFQWQQSTTK